MGRLGIVSGTITVGTLLFIGVMGGQWLNNYQNRFIHHIPKVDMDKYQAIQVLVDKGLVDPQEGVSGLTRIATGGTRPEPKKPNPSVVSQQPQQQYQQAPLPSL